MLPSMKIPRDQFQGRTFSVDGAAGKAPSHVNINDLLSITSLTFQGLRVNTSDANVGGLAPGQTASIALPPSIANLLPDGVDIRVAFTFYRDASLFPVMNSTRENGQTVVGSSVISAQVSGIADGMALDSPVQLFFVLTNAPVPGPNDTVSRSCAFWDFNAASELI